VRIYNLKSNEDLYDRWSKVAKKTNLRKMKSLDIVQNDMQVTNKQLSDWFTSSKEEILKVKEDFDSIIGELIALREETLKYLSAQVKKQDKENGK
jgi:hypothetical protein